MNSKEVVKFFSGFAANQVLIHAAFAMSGAQFTIFGIAYGGGLNATAAIVWATALALLIYHAWINRWRGVVLLLRLRFGILSALALAVLFVTQVGLAYHFRDNEARTIASLTILAWVYLGLACILFVVNGRPLIETIRVALGPTAAPIVGRPGASEIG
ncbi:hypothetical protein [Bradyrhizobium liaoningense]